MTRSDISSNGAPNVDIAAGDDAEAIGAAECDAVEVQVGGDAAEVNVERASRELVGEVVHAIAVDITGAHGARKLSIIVGGRGDGVHVGRCNAAVIRKRPRGGIVRGRGQLCHRDSHKRDHADRSHGGARPNRNLHASVAQVTASSVVTMTLILAAEVSTSVLLLQLGRACRTGSGTQDFSGRRFEAALSQFRGIFAAM